MNIITICFLSRIAMSALLVIGAIGALFIGFHLYKDGIGINKENADIHLMQLKASIKSTGAVVMITSIAWALLGYLSLPKYVQNDKSTQVAHLNSFNSKNNLNVYKHESNNDIKNSNVTKEPEYNKSTIKKRPINNEIKILANEENSYGHVSIIQKKDFDGINTEISMKTKEAPEGKSLKSSKSNYSSLVFSAFSSMKHSFPNEYAALPLPMRKE